MLHTRMQLHSIQFNAYSDSVNYLQIGFSGILILIFVCGLIFSSTSLNAQVANPFSEKMKEVGLAVGFVGGGEVSMDFDPYVTKKTSSFMVKGMYDSYLLPGLATGAYVQIANCTVNLHDTRTE